MPTQGGDAFPTEPTQWADEDLDGYGDNPTGVTVIIHLMLEKVIKMETQFILILMVMDMLMLMTYSLVKNHNGMIAMLTALATIFQELIRICAHR